MATRSKLAVILHADVVGSTALVQKNESVAHERIQDVFRRFSATIESYGGIAHEIRGDALVAEFARASDAVSAALAFQFANEDHNKGVIDDIRPEIRIGISLGEVVIADGTITGAGVVLAQRLEQLAEPGGVCLQGAAYETVPQRLSFNYESLGEQKVKGFEEPVRAYTVGLDNGQVIPAPDPSIRSGMPALELPDKPSIAVLPFDNMSEDSEQEYFADGMTEDIITGLSRFHSLFVVARNSTFIYKSRVVDVRQVARELGVRYVLEGSIRKGGNRIRVTAQLIDALTGNHIWAERYDRQLEDLFALQDEITETLVGAIAPEIDQAERQRAERHTPGSVGSWLMFQKGLSAYYETTEQSLKVAVRIFDDICRQDSGFAQAHAMAGDTRLRQAMHFERGRTRELVDVARECARKAKELDNRDALGFCVDARALSIQGDHESAIRLAEQGIAHNPNSWMAHHSLGFVLIVGSRFEAGLEALDNAQRLSPHSAFSAGTLSMRTGALVALRRFDEAALVAELGIDAAYPRPSTFIYLAAAHAHLGHIDQARAALKKLHGRHPNYSQSYLSHERINTGALSWEAVGEILLEGLRLCSDRED
jgi:TolB-like protein